MIVLVKLKQIVGVFIVAKTGKIGKKTGICLLATYACFVVYLIINIDEVIKLPAVYNHYKKYLWVKDLTAKTEERNV